MRKKLFVYSLVLFCAGLAGCATTTAVGDLYQRAHKRNLAALRASPEDIDLRIDQAYFYGQFHDHQKVKDLLSGLQNQEAKILLVKALVRLKEYTQALEVFDRLGILEDNEYLFLYGFTLEKKNLFPRAVKTYKQVGGEFKKQAKERVKNIGIKIEEGVPDHIRQILNEQKAFLAQIEDEEAVILYVDEETRITPENTAISTYHIIQQVLKEKGKDIAEVQIGYDSTDERVELEYARVITPEGKVVYAGKENIRDVSKYLNFPLYSNARVFIVSMPSVEIGAIIEYKVKIYASRLINDKDFTFIYRLRERYPVAYAKFKLIVPASRRIKIKTINPSYAKGINMKPHKIDDGADTVYVWDFKEISPIIPEEKMPPIPKINPAMKISSFNAWQEIYYWWRELYRDKIELSGEVKKFTKNLIKNCASDLEKAKKIYEFCARDVRYVAVEYGESGHEPHYANEVFWNRYGDCKDKAILLVAMMRYVGLEAYPVLIPTREVYSIEEDFPSVNFNHAIAAMKLDGKIIFMDPTAATTSFGDLPPGDQDRNVLVFFDDKYNIIRTPLLKHNSVTYDMKIEIDKNEDALIERSITTDGFYTAGQRYYLKYTHPRQIKDNLEKKILEISPFSRLIDYTIDNIDDLDQTPVLKYSFRSKKFLNPAKNLRIVPSLSDVDIDAGYAGKEKRVFPIEFAGIFRKISRISIKLPVNLKIKHLPESRHLQTKWFDFITNYSEKGKFLEIYQEFSLKKKFISLDDYSEFKEALEETFYLLKGEIILQKL